MLKFLILLVPARPLDGRMVGTARIWVKAGVKGRESGVRSQGSGVRWQESGGRVGSQEPGVRSQVAGGRRVGSQEPECVAYVAAAEMHCK